MGSLLKPDQHSWSRDGADDILIEGLKPSLFCRKAWTLDMTYAGETPLWTLKLYLGFTESHIRKCVTENHGGKLQSPGLMKQQGLRWQAAFHGRFLIQSN